MRTVRVAEAEGPVLDWMVATAGGWNYTISKSGFVVIARQKRFTPSSDWAQGGPIIEREGINLSVDYQDSALSNDMVQIGWKGNLWNNSVPGTAGFLQWAYGPTPLIAAMRCFCVSKLGETVEVPEELA